MPEPLTAEQVTTALQEALQPYAEIMGRIVQRVEAVESNISKSSRSSLDGQETN